ncbi:MAG: hypothetical protein ACYDC3_16735, partial [Candidatus Binataceae bacterium]
MLQIFGVRIIARRSLLLFVASLRGRKAVKVALDAWFHETQRAEWSNSAEVKQSYGTAIIIGSDRKDDPICRSNQSGPAP